MRIILRPWSLDSLNDGFMTSQFGRSVGRWGNSKFKILLTVIIFLTFFSIRGFSITSVDPPFEESTDHGLSARHTKYKAYKVQRTTVSASPSTYTQNKKRTNLSLKKEPLIHILNNPLESQIIGSCKRASKIADLTLKFALLFACNVFR